MATDLEKLVVQLSADIKGYEREMRKAVGVSHKQAREIENRFRAMQGRLDRTGKSAARSLVAPFSGVAAALGGRELIRMTGVWTDLTSRVNLAAGSLDKGAAVMQRVSEMARRTYSGLEQTAEGYLSFSTVLGELGVSTDRQLDFVESLNNALVVSGAKGQVAESVMSALSKAMALGTLSGVNLNTVISSGGRVTQALADSMGVTTMQLRKLGSEGKIGRREMLGITSQLGKLRDEAKKMPGTIQDGFMLLNNALLEYVGQGDKATGVSAKIAEALELIADNFDTVADAGLQVAAVIAGALVGRSLVMMIRTAGVGVTSIVAMTKALAAMRIAGLGASLALGPMGLLLGGVLAGGAILYANAGSKAAEQTAGLRKEMEALGLYSKTLVEEIGEAGRALDDLSNRERIRKIKDLRLALEALKGNSGLSANLFGNSGELGDIVDRARRGVGIRAGWIGGSEFEAVDQPAVDRVYELSRALRDSDIAASQTLKSVREIETVDLSQAGRQLVVDFTDVVNLMAATELRLEALGGGEALRQVEMQIAGVRSEMQYLLDMPGVDQKIVKEFIAITEQAENGERSADDLQKALARIADADPAVAQFIAKLMPLITMLRTLRGEASAASAAVAAATGAAAPSPGRGAGVVEYWADRRKAEAFIADQNRINGLSRERQDIERRTAAILKDAGEAGAQLTAAQAEQLAVEQAAADARRSKEGRGGGKKGKSEYTDEVTQIREAIAALEVEAKALNGAELSLSRYGDVAAYAQKRMELLVAAKKQGLEITPQLSAQIDKLAQDYVTAADAVERARNRHQEFESALSETRSSMESAFTGLITGAHSFKDALSQVLGKLAEMAASRAFASLWDGVDGKGGIGKGVGGFLKTILGFSGGGYTGPGGVHQPAGVVHKGEVVWSQRDVARVGGPAAADAIRRGLSGYDAGGVVSAATAPALPSVASLRRSAAGQGASSGGTVTVIAQHDPGIMMQVIDSRVSSGIASNNRMLSDRRYLTGGV